MPLADWAEQIARGLLAQHLPRRWSHSQAVAAAARNLSARLGKDGDEHGDLIVAAAWLHDIGYSPAIAVTGFHPLDGARHLRDTEHADAMVCRLVANHTAAAIEAAERGLASDLAREFPMPPNDLLDALTYCDMTTGPDGQPMDAGQRIADILSRYGPGDPVHRAISASAPYLTAVVTRVESKLNVRPLASSSSYDPAARTSRRLFGKAL